MATHYNILRNYSHFRSVDIPMITAKGKLKKSATEALLVIGEPDVPRYSRFDSVSERKNKVTRFKIIRIGRKIGWDEGGSL